MVQPFSFGEGKTPKQRKKRSDKQEKTLAQELKSLGGATKPGSGNQWHSKGDVEDKEFLHECKYTQYKSYSLTLKTWKEIEEKAFSMGGKIPAMHILLDEGGEDLELIVLSKDDYLALRGL
jgi:hypothetical protein